MRFSSKSLSVLGIDKQCDWATIKRAYNQLVLIHHPDKGGSCERFREIQEAFDMLSEQQHDNNVSGTKRAPHHREEEDREEDDREKDADADWADAEACDACIKELAAMRKAVADAEAEVIREKARRDGDVGIFLVDEALGTRHQCAHVFMARKNIKITISISGISGISGIGGIGGISSSRLVARWSEQDHDISPFPAGTVPDAHQGAQKKRQTVTAKVSGNTPWAETRALYLRREGAWVLSEVVLLGSDRIIPDSIVGLREHLPDLEQDRGQRTAEARRCDARAAMYRAIAGGVSRFSPFSTDAKLITVEMLRVDAEAHLRAAEAAERQAAGLRTAVPPADQMEGTPPQPASRRCERELAFGRYMTLRGAVYDAVVDGTPKGRGETNAALRALRHSGDIHAPFGKRIV